MYTSGTATRPGLNIRCDVVGDPRNGEIVVRLSENRISPEIDETWTRAGVRKLISLLKKRERILEKMEALVRREHVLEYAVHDDLQRILDGEY